MASLHVAAAAAAAEVLVVAIIKHIDSEAHWVHIRMHKMLAHAHQAPLLLLCYFHKMLCRFSKYFVKVLLLLVETSLYLLIELFKQLLLLCLNLRADGPII